MKVKIYRVYVFMGCDQWGNELMDKLAKAEFAKYPGIDPLVVTVYEHGGWCLSYLRDGTIVGTANDMAVLGERAQAFNKQLETYGFETEFLPDMRYDREKLEFKFSPIGRMISPA